MQVPPLPLIDARHCSLLWYMQLVAPLILEHHFAPWASAGVGVAKAITPVTNATEVAVRMHLRSSAGTSWAFKFRIITSFVGYRTVHVWSARQYQVMTWLKTRNHPCRKVQKRCSTLKPRAATKSHPLLKNFVF
jgi:hypothetical protein